MDAVTILVGAAAMTLTFAFTYHVGKAVAYNEMLDSLERIIASYDDMADGYRRIMREAEDVACDGRCEKCDTDA